MNRATKKIRATTEEKYEWAELSIRHISDYETETFSKQGKKPRQKL